MATLNAKDIIPAKVLKDVGKVARLNAKKHNSKVAILENDKIVTIPASVKKTKNT